MRALVNPPDKSRAGARLIASDAGVGQKEGL